MPDGGLLTCSGFSFTLIRRREEYIQPLGCSEKQDQREAGWGTGRWGYYTINTLKTIEIVNLPCCLLYGKEKKQGQNAFRCSWTHFFPCPYHKLSACAVSCQGIWRAFLKLALSGGSPVLSKSHQPCLILLCFASLCFPAFVVNRGKMKSRNAGILQKVRYLEGFVGGFRSKALLRGGVQR